MRSLSLSLGILAATTIGLVAHDAEACGGMFCNASIRVVGGVSRQMVVDQSGENIIFVMDQGKVEAHIQIQYQGDAAHFSWVLPVQSLPEVEVGSQALIDRLLAATAPTYGYSTQVKCFGGGGGGGIGGCGSTGTGGSSSGSLLTSSPPSVPSLEAGVDVVFKKSVGAFEVTVLQGGTTQEVLTWLTNNGYQTPTATAGLLDGYVANHYLFVAVKLTGGVGIDQIHPLVVRYPGNQPCVPIKLTAVAAVEDMGIRTFFLGTKRVVPKNYKHVVLNPAMLDWVSLGANYKELIGRSVDSPVANGRAFVTEYAGSFQTGPSIAQPTWNADAFRTAAAIDVVDLLQKQGLAKCSDMSCTFSHPLVLPLLREFLPVPASLVGLGTDGGAVSDAGIDAASDLDAASGLDGASQLDGANDDRENRFYSCLRCYQLGIDQAKWNNAAFAAALSTRIIEPARHADALLAKWTYATRLFTTISPAEMSEDPEFIEYDGLDAMSNSNSAVRDVRGTASAMVLPGGRQVALTASGTWPDLRAQMPWAERVEDFSSGSKSPIVLIDNGPRIDAALQQWNGSQRWPAPIPPCGASFTAIGDCNTTIGTPIGSAADNLTPRPNMDDPSCACRIGRTGRSPIGLLGFVGLAGLAVRRRRASR